MNDKRAREVLGVGVGASSDEVSIAYREQCKKHHPDVVAGEGDWSDVANANLRIREINEAYEFLKQTSGVPVEGDYAIQLDEESATVKQARESVARLRNSIFNRGFNK